VKSGNAASVLIGLGFLFGASGLFVGGFWMGLLYFGVSWLVAGVVYGFAGRSVTRGGLLVALAFGGAGALIWLFMNLDSDQNEGVTTPNL